MIPAWSLKIGKIVTAIIMFFVAGVVGGLLLHELGHCYLAWGKVPHQNWCRIHVYALWNPSRWLPWHFGGRPLMDAWPGWETDHHYIWPLQSVYTFTMGFILYGWAKD